MRTRGAGVARSLQCKRPQTIYSVSRAQRAVCMGRVPRKHPRFSTLFARCWRRDCRRAPLVPTMRTVPVTNATEQRLLRSVLDRLEDGNISGAQHLLRERLNALAQLAQQESTRNEVDFRRARAARVVSLDRPMLLAVVEVTAEVFAVVFDAHILALLRRTCHAARSGGVFNTHHTTSLAYLASQRPMMHPCRMRPHQCPCKRTCASADSIRESGCCNRDWCMHPILQPDGTECTHEDPDDLNHRERGELSDLVQELGFCKLLGGAAGDCVDTLRVVEVARRKYHALLWYREDCPSDQSAHNECIDAVNEKPFDAHRVEDYLFDPQIGGDVEGAKLLLRACYANNYDAARFLMLEAGALGRGTLGSVTHQADPRQTRWNRECLTTPLHAAAAVGSVPLMELICTADVRGASKPDEERVMDDYCNSALGAAIHHLQPAACKWLIEEGGHHDLSEPGTQLAQDELAKVLCGRYPWLGVATWHRDEFDEDGYGKSDAWWEYREVDLGEYTRRGRRAMQAACVLRRLATARVLAEHGSPRLTWEVLRNPDWSKLTSGVFAVSEE